MLVWTSSVGDSWTHLASFDPENLTYSTALTLSFKICLHGLCCPDPGSTWYAFSLLRFFSQWLCLACGSYFGLHNLQSLGLMHQHHLMESWFIYLPKSTGATKDGNGRMHSLKLAALTLIELAQTHQKSCHLWYFQSWKPRRQHRQLKNQKWNSMQRWLLYFGLLSRKYSQLPTTSIARCSPDLQSLSHWPTSMPTKWFYFHL